METLRFAPIVRVSSEKQERQGESLSTQRKQIIQYVESFKGFRGVIPESCWQYSGQEHATPDHERKRLEKLLTDSSKGLFDAVIVCDASRWSRDNLKSKEGLKILRDNGIRFFVGTMEYDLFNPEHAFYLGISAEIGEFQAQQGSQKSIINRIELAKRGVPSAGALPHGRTYDKKTGKWDVHPVKKQIIQKCAERYLKGDSLKDIALTYNMDMSNLWSILFHHSGGELKYRFRYKNIDETVTIAIPRLLEDDVIAEVKAKGKAKRTYNKRGIKFQYLLGHLVFCARCGNTMTGFTSASGRRYYRHSRGKLVTCATPKFVYSTELENSVLIHLITTLGDIEKVNKAINRATPDYDRIESLKKEKAELTEELKKISLQRERIIERIADGLITDAEARIKLDKWRGRERIIGTRITTIESETSNVPDPQRVKRTSELGIKVLRQATMDSPQDVFKKSYAWKRKLVESAFGGTDAKGQRLGVYVDKTDTGWSFEIRGILENTLLSLPLPDEYLLEAFHVHTDIVDEDQALKEIRSSISNLGKSLPCQYHKIFQQADYL